MSLNMERVWLTGIVGVNKLERNKQMRPHVASRIDGLHRHHRIGDTRNGES